MIMGQTRKERKFDPTNKGRKSKERKFESRFREL